MVLFVIKYEVPLEKAEAYGQWAGSAVSRAVSQQGITEFRAYRPLIARNQVVLTAEFARLQDWTAWYSADETQAMLDELGTLTVNLEGELWGPSPLVPTPIRPGR